MFQQENEQLTNKIEALEEKLELQGKEVKSQNLEVHSSFSMGNCLAVQLTDLAMCKVPFDQELGHHIPI